MAASKRLDQDVYEQNVKFWDRAWGPVKAAYTQMPDLPYIEALPGKLSARGAARVLDLGCGSGWLSIFLARQGFQVTGIDISSHAVDLARDWAANENLSITFKAADITEMPFAKGSFDAVVANSIFEHLTFELAVKTIAALANLLKPDGLLFACFDNVGTGPGDYYELEDGTHVYTDKGRSGMLLRNFADAEISKLFADWKVESLSTIEGGSRILFASTPALT